jgi:hypothetical protein
MPASLPESTASPIAARLPAPAAGSRAEQLAGKMPRPAIEVPAVELAGHLGVVEHYFDAVPLQQRVESLERLLDRRFQADQEDLRQFLGDVLRVELARIAFRHDHRAGFFQRTMELLASLARAREQGHAHLVSH